MSEKIALNLEREGIVIASIQKRFFSFVIDEVLLSVLFMVIYWDYLSRFSDQQALIEAISALTLQFVAIRTMYQTFFIWYYGATVGKIAMKISCIDTEYLDKPNFISSLIRAMMRNVSEACFYLGFVWAMANPIKQAWHDKISKVVVIDVA